MHQSENLIKQCFLSWWNCNINLKLLNARLDLKANVQEKHLIFAMQLIHTLI